MQSSSAKEYIEKIVNSEWYQSFKTSQSKKEVKLLWKYITNHNEYDHCERAYSNSDYYELFIISNGKDKEFILECGSHEEIKKLVDLLEW